MIKTEQVICKYEPRGEKGLEGFNLNEKYTIKSPVCQGRKYGYVIYNMDNQLEGDSFWISKRTLMKYFTKLKGEQKWNMQN